VLTADDSNADETWKESAAAAGTVKSSATAQDDDANSVKRDERSAGTGELKASRSSEKKKARKQKVV